MIFLELKNIVKKFDKQVALNNINARIEKGELVCILGPSGCGKTTLLRIIAGLEAANDGQVFIDGTDATSLPPAKRNYGIVFQSYALFPNMTVLGNVLFGLQQKKELSREDKLTKAIEALSLVDLAEHKNKYPRQLSGGMQQRTALARAIALSPAFLLLDEPLSALDAKVRQKLRGDIRSIQRNLGITTIMVTHDQEEALTMADKIIVMNNSFVEQIGTPREIYNHPATPFVANFIGTMNYYHNKTGEICAVRPENIEVSRLASTDGYAASIRTLEFKGSTTRIYGTLPDKSEICMDVASETATELNLIENSIIFLRMPQENQNAPASIAV
ncbi:MAG: ATP-binding cassette domain-containing protein [Coriobacteriia bacterium]|nr:ATP-binding cassette domain-containing protein [Coriobacteriia bacterium]MCL2749887.1 ATP-binding cassette domain-containing protein [Coriobacteriia bacterium]